MMKPTFVSDPPLPDGFTFLTIDDCAAHKARKTHHVSWRAVEITMNNETYKTPGYFGKPLSHEELEVTRLEEKYQQLVKLNFSTPTAPWTVMPENLTDLSRLIQEIQRLPPVISPDTENPASLRFAE